MSVNTRRIDHKLKKATERRIECLRVLAVGRMANFIEPNYHRSADLPAAQPVLRA